MVDRRYHEWAHAQDNRWSEPNIRPSVAVLFGLFSAFLANDVQHRNAEIKAAIFSEAGHLLGVSDAAAYGPIAAFELQQAFEDLIELGMGVPGGDLRVEVRGRGAA